MTENVLVDVQNASASDSVPHECDIRDWLVKVVGDSVAGQSVEISVRVVDEYEGRVLNHRYRQIDKATNVLSFSVDDDNLPSDVRRPLGDIVLCAPIVEREAAEQEKKIADHWLHLLVHGALHLLGYDHETDDDARQMEAIERDLLATQGVDDPYSVKH